MYYHISNKDLGPNPILKAKLPLQAFEDVEGSIPRVCFSESILGCLLSLSGHPLACVTIGILSALKDNKVINNRILNPVIYVTQEALIKPADISDYKKTKEHHSYRDIQVTRFGYISISNCLANYSSSNIKLIKITNRKSSAITKEQLNLLKNITANSLFKLNNLIRWENNIE